MNYYRILILFLFLFSCSDVDQEVYGCTDKEACNYNPNATSNWEGECIYQEIGCDCEGNLHPGICDCDGSIDSDFDQICDNVDICVGEYDNNYSCNDIDVLYDFLVNNHDSINVSTISIEDILNFPFDYEFNEEGRLDYLSLIEKNITIVPSTVNQLSHLSQLFLNDNSITELPLTICEINDSCEIYVQHNQLCDINYSDFTCIDNAQWNSQDCDE